MKDEINKENEDSKFEEYFQPLRTFNGYQKEASRTAGTSGGPTDDILNWTLGVVGEAGELANEIKKAIYHNHGLDYVKLVSEIGDVLWYLSQLCTSLGINMDLVVEQNLRKLAKRYPDGWSAERSINREED